jgi:hypothetical protein
VNQRGLQTAAKPRLSGGVSAFWRRFRNEDPTIVVHPQQAAKKLTNACCTTVERRFSAA